MTEIYAFPYQTEIAPNVWSKGLTKREWFAAMAMIGLLADCRKDSSSVAEMAIEYADKLVEQLLNTNQ